MTTSEEEGGWEMLKIHLHSSVPSFVHHRSSFKSSSFAVDLSSSFFMDLHSNYVDRRALLAFFNNFVKCVMMAKTTTVSEEEGGLERLKIHIRSSVPSFVHHGSSFKSSIFAVDLYSNFFVDLQSNYVDR